MTLSLERLSRLSRSTGYAASIIEKVACLLDVLNAMILHPVLKGKLALKGGTALNLFILDMPRLSIDIDLNYIGAAGREEMLAERPSIAQALHAVLSRQGYALKRAPFDHAGGKWRASYNGATGQPGNLEIDINFVYRIPLWGIQSLDSRPLGTLQARSIPVVDIHELAAGKFAALFSRTRARDLFDTVRIGELIEQGQIMSDRLRIGFVVFGAGMRMDWRTITPETIELDADQAARELLPVLRIDSNIFDMRNYVRQMIRTCKKIMELIIPFSPAEKNFLDLVLDRGRIEPSLLTDNPGLQKRILHHPLLAWKAMNVRRRGGN